MSSTAIFTQNTNKYNNSAKSCYLVNINNENDNEISLYDEVL
jgi:hypothetical protein